VAAVFGVAVDDGDEVGRVLVVGFADGVADGMVAMMGVVLRAPVPPGLLGALLLVLSAAQPLSPNTATTATVAISGLFMMAMSDLILKGGSPRESADTG
jgi:hypothetical protein